MAPEIVSDEETEMLNGKRVHVRRGKVLKGFLFKTKKPKL